MNSRDNTRQLQINNINNSNKYIIGGVMQKVLNALFDNNNVSYVIVSEENINLGTQNTITGKWSGMSGYMQRNECDLMLGPPLMSYGRQQIMTFTHSLMYDKSSIMTKDNNDNDSDSSGQLRTNLLLYLTQFSSQIWITIIVTLLIVMCVCVLREYLLCHKFDLCDSIGKHFVIILQIALQRSE